MIFKAGRLAYLVLEWEKITDPQIHDIVENCHIDLQSDADDIEAISYKGHYSFNEFENQHIDDIENLMSLKVILPVEEEDQILSPIFLRPRGNVEYRLILNKKND